MRDYKEFRPNKAVRGARKKERDWRWLTPWLVKGAVLAVCIAVLYTGVVFARDELRSADYFSIAEIVVDGAKRVDKGKIAALSGIKRGDNILAADLNGASGRVEEEPWVEKASVRRVLPRTVLIEVTEREPYALLKNGGELIYLDRNGTAFKILDQGDDQGYPLLSGISREELGYDETAVDAVLKTFDFLDTQGGEWPQDLAISEIFVDKRQGITIYCGGMEIKAGFGDFPVKVSRLRKVLEDIRRRKTEATYIDLTYTGQVVVR